MQVAPRILVVDDEPKICDFMEILLRREGYEPETTTDPAEAVEMIKHGSFNLVIADLKMPGMDGFELAKRAKEIDRDIPFVIITGYATINTAVTALREGCDDFVTKPFKLEEMRKVVAKTLEKTNLKIRNLRLFEDLKEANRQLAEHKKKLENKVELTDEELRRANAELQSTVKNLSMIYEIGASATSELDLNKTLYTCVKLVAEKLEVSRVTIMLRENDHLVVRACCGENSDKALGGRTRLGEGVAGIAAQKGKPLLINDIRRDPRFRSDNSNRYSTGSLICQPLNYKQATLGVLCVTDRKSGAQFTDEDAALLSAIAHQVAPSIENAALYRRLEESSFSAVRALVAAVEAKDRYTSGHSLRVMKYAMKLGRALGLNDEEIITLERASQLHDLGKLSIADHVLNKPAKLSPDEYDIIKKHPEVGEQIIAPLRFLEKEAAAIRHHHERPDGKGYPDGLRGKNINIVSRILSIADAFDAMTSPRPYRAAKEIEYAIKEIQSLRGAQFDSELACVFCEKVLPDGIDDTNTV